MTVSLDLTAGAIGGWLETAAAPLVVGLCGAQGCGKSTLARHLKQHFDDQGLTTAVLSLDDLYLSQEVRATVADTVHPMFATRGVPGTHDVALGEHVLDALKHRQPVALPRFDKATDQPLPESDWLQTGPVDLVLFEGWCVGAVPQADHELTQPVNALEQARDEGTVWRRAVNEALKGAYRRLFSRLDRLILLAAPDFAVVRDWRTQQEHGLRHRLRREGRVGTRVMTDTEVARFIQFYERLTRHILTEMPARADLTLWLDAARRVTHHKRLAA